MSPCCVRRATAVDVVAASAVLADAFADYPWTRWTVDSADHSERVGALQRLSMERVALPYGAVWVAVDEGDEIVGAAMWGLPDATVPASVLHQMELEQAKLEGARHEASVAAEAAVSRLRPTVSHYYLGTVGTRRDHQRHGHGAALLAPVLDRAKEEHTQVFLETSSPENVEFYTRLGFVTVAELDIPEAGPHVWAMARTPLSPVFSQGAP